jgi:hypothetical protein
MPGIESNQSINRRRRSCHRIVIRVYFSHGYHSVIVRVECAAPAMLRCPKYLLIIQDVVWKAYSEATNIHSRPLRWLTNKPQKSYSTIVKHL